MTRFEYCFPELGEGMHEGEIVKVHISPGQEITDDDIIIEVQNDKAVVEVPSPVNGKVLEVLAKDGDVKKIGEVIAIIEAVGELPDQEEMETPVETKQEPASSKLEKDPIENKEQSEAVKPAIETEKEKAKEKSLALILATPSVRRFAHEQNVDLTSIQGSGKHGHITREDVQAVVQSGEKTIQPVPSAESLSPQEVTQKTSAADGHEKEDRVPFKGMRKAISNAMTKSAYTAPHVTLMDEVDVTKLVSLRSKFKPLAEKKGIKLTYLSFIVKALVAAARKFPDLNAMIDEQANEIVYKKYYHIGIATDTNNGLLVPVIHHADRKNIWMIAEEIINLAAQGREGKLSSQQMQGGTLSITNIGSVGGMFFSPIINFPEVAILGVGRISEKPIVKEGEIVPAQVLALSLSFDHRIIDGATAQNFINYIKQLLHDPDLLIMEV